MKNRDDFFAVLFLKDAEMQMHKLLQFIWSADLIETAVRDLNCRSSDGDIGKINFDLDFVRCMCIKILTFALH